MPVQPAELKLAQQVRGTLLPLKATKPRVKAAPVTDELKKFSVYKHLRNVRGQLRNKGKREKAAKLAAEEGLGSARR